MTSITASVNTGAVPVPTVQVDVVIDNPANVAFFSVTRGVTTVWYGTTTSGAYSFVDHTAPLGVPVTYRLQVTYTDGTAASATAAPVTITGTSGCFLTVASSGLTVGVTLASWEERAAAARRSVLGVAGRADPVVISDVALTPSGEWTLYTETDAQATALWSLLSAPVVVLRPQPGTSIRGTSVAVGEVTETRFSGNGRDQRRWFTVQVQEIADLPGTALPLSATLLGLSKLATTLLELSAVRPTLLQLSQIPAP